MNVEPLKNDEIYRLWPTTVMKQLLPGREQVIPSLVELASDSPDSEELGSDSEASKWLHAQVEHGARQYFSRMSVKCEDRILVSTRFEVHGVGGYRSLSNEPGAVLSGRFGVTLPSGMEPGPKRDDLHPGYISFFDPRSAMNMNAINRDPYLNYHRSIELKPGMLLMWPSYLSYFVHPNQSRTLRVSVAFNIYKEGGRG